MQSSISHTHRCHDSTTTRLSRVSRCHDSMTTRLSRVSRNRTPSGPGLRRGIWFSIEPPQGTAGQPPTTMFGGFTLVLDQAPVVVAPPLEGSGWVDSGGCCAPASYHRTATLPINGRLRAAQRFAIDFVQLNADDRLFS